MSIAFISMFFVAELLSCSKTKVGFNSVEIIANDNKTKITLLNNTYKLIKPFNNSINEVLPDSTKSYLICCANYPSIIFSDREINASDEYHFSIYDKLFGEIIFLENDYLNFVNLVKVDGQFLPIMKNQWDPDIENSYTIICRDTKNLINYNFYVENLHIDVLEKIIAFNLFLEISCSVRIDNVPEYINASLGKFILTNALLN